VKPHLAAYPITNVLFATDISATEGFAVLLCTATENIHNKIIKNVRLLCVAKYYESYSGNTLFPRLDQIKGMTFNELELQLISTACSHGRPIILIHDSEFL
jgi:hypothetical protein